MQLKNLLVLTTSFLAASALAIPNQDPPSDAAPPAPAPAGLKDFLITFPSGTPSELVAEAKKDLELAGVEFLHEYKFIAGWAVKTTENLVQTFREKWITTNTRGHSPTIEEDQVVTIS